MLVLLASTDSENQHWHFITHKQEYSAHLEPSEVLQAELKSLQVQYQSIGQVCNAVSLQRCPLLIALAAVELVITTQELALCACESTMRRKRSLVSATVFMCIR